MDYETLIARLDATACAALKRAVEIGKFPDGRRLSDQQRALCMEAVLAWELQNCPPEQRTGYIDRGRKTEGEACGKEGDGEPHTHSPEEQILHIRSRQ